MSDKPLKVEIKKNVALRDILYTIDKCLTTIGNKIGESFSNTTLYPAIESNGGTMTGGVVSSEAEKLSSSVKLVLLGDVTGSVVFDGSEGSDSGVDFYNSITSINGNSISNIFDNDGYAIGSTTLGKVITDEATLVKSLEGKIGDTNLVNIFEYDEDGSLITKKSDKTTQFDDYRYIKLEGDFVGGLRSKVSSVSTNGSKFIQTNDPETITNPTDYSYIEGYANVEQYIPTSNTLHHEWKNPITDVIEYVETITSEVSAHLNAVNYFVYEIEDDIFENVSSDTFFFVQPNVSSIDEYNTYSKMNMVFKYEDNKWKIYCYTNEVVPDMTLVKILKVGRINSKN